MNFQHEIWKIFFYIIGVLIVATATTAATSYVRLNVLESENNANTAMILEIRKDVKQLLFYCGGK